MSRLRWAFRPSVCATGVESPAALHDGRGDFGIAAGRDVLTEKNAIRLDGEHRDPGGSGGCPIRREARALVPDELGCGQHRVMRLPVRCGRITELPLTHATIDHGFAGFE